MLKAQIHANSKAIKHHARLIKFIVYLVDFLSTKYKLTYLV